MLSIFAAVLINFQAISVKTVDVAPRLDGKIDSIWIVADSVTQLTQLKPDYGKPSKFKTVVKFLQDRENLYILGVCYTGKFRPEAGFRNSDYIAIHLDPFYSRQEAYYFEVQASGKRSDATISDNGTHWDFSWDAYWFSKAKVYDSFYVVEIKIPFRSLRFKKGLTRWGLQIERYVPQEDEVSYWRLYPRDRINDPVYYGELLNVNPGVSGHGMEFYPVGVLRRDTYYSNPVSKSHIGFDFAWNILPDLMLNITVKPDFAQIEADPFALNLSKFERYFSERRPFFIEAKEIFSPSTVNFGDIYWPFVVFYSRRIGKRLPDGSEVPIDFGSKLTYKSSNLQFGWISVYTEEKSCAVGNRSLTEPAAFWNVARMKFFSADNFSTGFLISSKSSSGRTDFNFDFDGHITRGNHRILYQGVSSRNDAGAGYGFKSAYIYTNLPLVIGAGISYSDTKLDLSSTGYLAQDPGIYFTGIMAHISYPEKSPILELTKAIYLKLIKDSTNRTSEYVLGPYLSVGTRSGHRMEIYLVAGKSFEYEQENMTYGAHIYFGKSSGEGAHYGIHWNISKAWNYQRGIFALVSDGGAWVSFSMTDRINGEVDLKSWIEFDTTNSIMDIYATIKPGINIGITPDMNVVLSTEIVPVYTDNWDLSEVRMGLRYEYDFLPKSKFYLVANRHYVNTDGKLEESESIYAVKLRVALPF